MILSLKRTKQGNILPDGHSFDRIVLDQHMKFYNSILKFGFLSNIFRAFINLQI